MCPGFAQRPSDHSGGDKESRHDQETENDVREMTDERKRRVTAALLSGAFGCKG